MFADPNIKAEMYIIVVMRISKDVLWRRILKILFKMTLKHQIKIDYKVYCNGSIRHI